MAFFMRIKELPQIIARIPSSRIENNEVLLGADGSLMKRVLILGHRVTLSGVRSSVCKSTLMKTNSTYFLLALTLILSSCSVQVDPVSDSQEEQASVETVYTYMEKSEGAPVARMMIAGMSCEQMCGSRIKATVAALPGVSETTLAFHAEGDVDTLTVVFDPKLVSEKDMVNAINGMQGAQYQVREVQLSKEAKTSYFLESDSEKRKGKHTPAKVGAEKLSIPNIFDALKRVSVI
jgi:copper chaperone CopZ